MGAGAVAPAAARTRPHGALVSGLVDDPDEILGGDPSGIDPDEETRELVIGPWRFSFDDHGVVMVERELGIAWEWAAEFTIDSQEEWRAFVAASTP